MSSSETTLNSSVTLATLEAVHRQILAPSPSATIHTSELAALPSFMYEKLRTIIDYKEEQLLRKNAIKRFLKRSLLLPVLTVNFNQIAHKLIRELILSRYIKNDSIPEKIIPDLAQVVAKYVLLARVLAEQDLGISRWRERLAGLAAVECDAYIHNPNIKNTYLSYSYQLLTKIIDLSEINSSADEKNLQLVLTIERVLERADKDMLTHYILLHYHPEWFGQEDPQKLVTDFSPNAQLFFGVADSTLSHNLGRRLMGRVRRLLVPVLIIRDCLTKKNITARELSNPNSKTDQLILEAYQNHWRSLRSKLRRKGLHAMVYIFLTKVILALLFELPYEKFIYGHVALVPLWINILVPPALMFIITMLIKAPDRLNKKVVVQAVRELGNQKYDTFYKTETLKERARKLWTKLTYATLYLITFIGSFGALIFLLWKLNFNPISAALFIFFISLVSFFGISLRQQAKQLKVLRGRETLLGFLIDFFSLPVIELGKWLSTTFDRINIFVFILDFLFELPFKVLLKIIEDWFAYLKEKKDEMM